MKTKLLIILFMLCSAVSFGQKGFPTSNAEKNEEWAFQNESDPFARRNAYTGAGGTITSGATIWSTQIGLSAGIVAKINLTITTTGPCRLIIQGGETANTFGFDRSTNVNGSIDFPKGGGSVTLPNIVAYEYSSITMQFTTPSTKDTVNVSYAANGRQYFGSSYFNAPYTYLQFSDSQTFSALGSLNGGSTGNYGSTAYGRRLEDTLRKQGVDIRLLNKGVSGITTPQYLQRVLTGKFDDIIRKASFIEIALGTNDASAGTSASQNFAANIRLFLNYIIARNKTAALILTAPPGTSVVAIGNNVAGYRTDLQSIVTQYQGLYPARDIRLFNRFLYVPNPVSSTDPNYTETGTGNQLHQRGDTGHLLEYQGLLPIILGTNMYSSLPKTL